MLDDLSAGYEWLTPRELPFVKATIADKDLLTRLYEQNAIDTIIHFAASVIVQQSFEDPLACYRNNTINTHALIESTARHGVRYFIFSSTSTVYGNGVATPTPENAWELHLVNLPGLRVGRGLNILFSL